MARNPHQLRDPSATSTKRDTTPQYITTRVVADHIGITALGKILGVTVKTINNWEQHGCPRNPDGTLSGPAVFTWYTQWCKTRFSVKNHTIREQELKLEKMELVNQKMRNETIPTAEHEAVLTSRATAWNEFWHKSTTKNLHHFVQQSREELVQLFATFGRELADVWTSRS